MPSSSLLTFRASYFFIALLLFVTEILIALFLHDGIVRPYIGDVLVVILLYCFLRSFLKLSIVHTAVSVLLFAYVLETLQYFKLVKLLGLNDYAFARTVIGTSFAWLDLLAYTVGIGITLVVERSIGQ